MAVQLLDILTEEEAVPAGELERMLERQRQMGGCLADQLVRSQLIDEDELFYLISERMGVPPLSEERMVHHSLTPEVRKLIPQALAEECVLLPLDLDVGKSTLSVVMLDPSDEWVGQRLRGAARVANLRPYLARRSSILGAVRAVYGRQHRYVLPGTDVVIEEKSSSRPPVEAIRGKVEIDAGLADEIASIQGADDLAAEMMATSIKPMPQPPTVDENAVTPTPVLNPLPPPGRLPGDDTDETLVPALRPEDETNEVLVAAARRESERTTIDGRFDGGGRPPRPYVPESEVTHVVSESVIDGDDEEPWMEETGTFDADTTGEPVVVLSPELPDDVTALLGELVASVGVLVSMLEERVDPGGALAREHARLSRLVAREIGLDGTTIDRVTVAAHLYGLDIALRRELDGERLQGVAEAFSSKPTRPGGLNPTLRSLGARALGLNDGQQVSLPLGALLISLVSDYLDLRLESCEESSDTVVQLLRASGADGQIVEALLRVIEDEETLVETRRSQVERR